MKIDVKNKKTVIDCENTSGVIYPSNKCVGAVSFINCENVTGIEFDVAMKVIDIDVSNLPLVKYINIQHTSIKELTAPETCTVYCMSNVIIYRK